MATLKDMLNEVLLLSGVDEKTSFVGEGTAGVERMVSLANQSVTYLMQEPWQALRARQELTLTSATEYALPSDYLAIIPDTMYTENHLFPADFPADTGFWSYLKSASGGSGARYHMRILGDELHVFEPDSGEKVYYEYQSNHPVLDTDGTTTKALFVADTDTFRLDDQLLIRDVLWRYKKLIGRPDWQVDALDFKRYENTKRGQDKGSQTIYPETGDTLTGEPWYNPWRPVPNV